MSTPLPVPGLNYVRILFYGTSHCREIWRSVLFGAQSPWRFMKAPDPPHSLYPIAVAPRRQPETIENSGEASLASYRTPRLLAEGLVTTNANPRAARDKRLTARPH
jgi:hypothetical protein